MWGVIDSKYLVHLTLVKYIFQQVRLSGLTQPTYNSGATNKRYVDLEISSNIYDLSIAKSGTSKGFSNSMIVVNMSILGACLEKFYAT